MIDAMAYVGDAQHHLPIVLVVAQVEPVAVTVSGKQILMDRLSCLSAVYATDEDVGLPSPAGVRSLPIILNAAGRCIPIEPIEVIKARDGDGCFAGANVRRTI